MSIAPTVDYYSIPATTTNWPNVVWPVLQGSSVCALCRATHTGACLGLKAVEYDTAGRVVRIEWHDVD